jgi:hypothetical protein
MRTAGALLVASLALAGCSGGDDASDRARPGDQATAADETGSGSGADNASRACRLLTLDEVGDLFGRAADVVPAEGDVPVGGGSDSCLWEATDEDGPTATIYQLQLSVFTGSGAFDPRAWGEDPETIDGLGDEAFIVRSGVLGTTAGYRAGDRSVFLSYAIPLGEDAPDSATQADEVVELLRTVDTRLGSP